MNYPVFWSHWKIFLRKTLTEPASYLMLNCLVQKSNPAQSHKSLHALSVDSLQLDTPVFILSLKPPLGTKIERKLGANHVLTSVRLILIFDTNSFHLLRSPSSPLSSQPPLKPFSSRFSATIHHNVVLIFFRHWWGIMEKYMNQVLIIE